MNAHTTPKNFALQLGALITVYISITSLLVLTFSIINIVFPDAADGSWFYDSNQSSIRFAIAVLAVFFPTYLALTRLVNQARRSESSLYHTLTRWVIYLSLLVGGLILLGNFVVTINSFLNGEATLRFLLKAFTLFVVVGGAVTYYWLDAKDYWLTRERRSVQIGALVAAFVLATVIYGFVNIEAPGVVRERDIDQEQIYDLQDMQWRIVAHYAEAGSLPESVAALYEVQSPPEAPAGRMAYEYEITGPDTYSLCAEFAEPSRESEYVHYKPTPENPLDYQNQNWEHAAGRWCFERVVSAPTVE
jgi:hypothetical protein